MKIFGFEISREKRGLNPDGTAYVQSPLATGLAFGDFYSQRTAMSLGAVYRCVDLISDSVAMLPIEVVKDSKTIDNHYLSKVFDDRTSIVSPYNRMKNMISDVLLHGAGFAFIHRDSQGRCTQMEYLPWGQVSVAYNPNNRELYYQAPIVSRKKIEPINMVHLVRYSKDGVNGISVISAADESLKIAKSSEASAKNFYAKGGNLSGVLTVQGNLTQEQRKDILNSWNTAYSGGGQGIAVLNGNMSYQAVQVNAKDAQLIETRQYNTKDICRFFGVDPSLIGETGGTTYSSVEAAQQAFLLHTLQPYIVMIEAEFTRKLLLPSEIKFRVNLNESALLRVDKTNQASYFQTLVSAGILTRNEARTELGYPMVDGADELQVAYSDVNQNTVNQPTDEPEDK